MKNNNTSVAQDMNRIFDLKGEQTNEVSDIISPVVIIKRSPDIIKKGTASNATSGTAYTTPSDKDFYLTNVMLSVTKDVTATSAETAATVILNGITVSILSLSTLTLTAQNMSGSLNFANPVKVDRGTAIQVTNTTNQANVRAMINIVGFTTETTKGV